MSLAQLMQKDEKLAIGLMSGTSADGVDAALVRINGHGAATEVKLEGYVCVPFTKIVREEILAVAGGEVGGTKRIAMLGAVLGQLYLQACRQLCGKAGVNAKDIDLIGSHGQTVYHLPAPTNYLGHSVTATLQIGEPSILCEEFGAAVVSDFRVRDIAAGGQGAPLVPYTEYILYSDGKADVALQNIGGIGNITFLPAGGGFGNVLAFDTGPGNVLMDAAANRLTCGKETYDPAGRFAAQHEINAELLNELMQDAYLAKKPPKTTGREYYNNGFLARVYARAAALNVNDGAVLRTLTRYTAQSIAYAVNAFLPAKPQRLIVGGGGSQNNTLMSDLRELLCGIRVLAGEDVGIDSNAKEAVAFAVLANEAVHGVANNVPTATGAAHPVVMGKISQ